MKLGLVLFKLWATLDFSIVLYLELDHLVQVIQLQICLVSVFKSLCYSSSVEWTHDKSCWSHSSHPVATGFSMFNIWGTYTMCFFCCLAWAANNIFCILGSFCSAVGCSNRERNMEYGMQSTSICCKLCSERNSFCMHIDWHLYTYVLIFYFYLSIILLPRSLLIHLLICTLSKQYFSSSHMNSAALWLFHNCTNLISFWSPNLVYSLVGRLWIAWIVVVRALHWLLLVVLTLYWGYGILANLVNIENPMPCIALLEHFAHIFFLHTGTIAPVFQFSSHSSWISSCKWHPSSWYHLISSSFDGKVMLWDLRTAVRFNHLLSHLFPYSHISA